MTCSIIKSEVLLISAMIIKSTYKPALQSYEPFHETVLSAIKKHAESGMNKIAFINGDDSSEVVTYQQVYDSAYAIATYLHLKGFHKNVACAVLPNLWHYSAFFLGVALNGGAVSGASALFTDYELQRQFVDSEATVVLTSEEFLPKVLTAAKKSPKIQMIIFIPKKDASTIPSGVINWNDVVSTPIKNNIPKAEIDLDKDILVLPYSSGTTGSPKGVMLTHRNFGTMMNIYRQQDALNNSPILDINWDNEKERIILFLPFYHVFGFGLLNLAMLQGNVGIIFSHFEPKKFCGAIQEHKIRFLPLVPPILVFLAKHPLCAEYDLSSVEFLICGAAPAGKDICEEISRKYPNIKYIQQGYGMTESTMATHMPDLKNGQPFGSVGKLASNLEMRIVDPSTGKDQKVGERGEICVRGPTIMLGYLGRPDATSSTIIDGWLHTGDIGYVDNDGNLFIVDRLKELIKVKGLQVAPAELEDILLSHPLIQDAAVIGIPDAKAGELPRAYVVRANQTLTEQDVTQFVSDKVSHYKRLAGGVEFVNEIPKSAAGKIFRRTLREKAMAKI